jgi:deoxyribose-phosphate aldolase
MKNLSTILASVSLAFNAVVIKMLKKSPQDLNVVSNVMGFPTGKLETELKYIKQSQKKGV